MGSKKAAAKLKALRKFITDDLMGYLGRVNACKQRLEKVSSKIAEEIQAGAEQISEALVIEFKGCLAEMTGQCEGFVNYSSQCYDKADELKQYCADNKKKHRFRGNIGEELDAISDKVDEVMGTINDVTAEFGPFEEAYNDFVKFDKRFL